MQVAIAGLRPARIMPDLMMLAASMMCAYDAATKRRDFGRSRAGRAHFYFDTAILLTSARQRARRFDFTGPMPQACYGWTIARGAAG